VAAAFFIGAASAALVLHLDRPAELRPSTAVVYSLALALIAGGAIGNLIDRIRLGFVVDFLDVSFGASSLAGL
jgi:signal peptidase II